MASLVCPYCGSNVFRGIKQCAYCGKVLELSDLSAGRAATGSDLPQGWRRHVDAWAGFALACPSAFSVHRMDPRIMIQGDPGGTVGAMLWPMRLDAPMDALQLAMQFVGWCRNFSRSFEAWRIPEPSGAPNRAVLRTRNQWGSLVIDGGATVYVDGPNAIISGFHAPADSVARLAPEMSQVLGSFRVVPPIPRQVFVEPVQGAFQALVPSGWFAKGSAMPNPMGGMAKCSFVCSADQQAMTSFSISSKFWMFPDNAFARGITKVMTLGLVKTPPYMPAMQFAQDWVVPKVLRKDQPKLEILGVTESPDMLPDLYADVARVGLTPETAGLTTACLTTRHNQGGSWIRRKTFLYVMRPRGPAARMSPVAGNWLAFLTGSYQAPEDEFDAVEPVLNGIRTSFRTNEMWRQREVARMNQMSMQLQQDTSNRLRQISQTLSQTTDIITSSYWERQKTYDHVFHQQANVTRGTTDVVDPWSNTVYNVPNSYDQYWKDSAGYIYGGSWNVQPDPTWQKLEPIRI